MAKKTKALWKYFHPLPDTLIVTAPRVTGQDERTTNSGLVVVEENSKVRAMYGMVCKVLRCGPMMEEFEGASLVLFEHCGTEIYSTDASDQAWIVTRTDILCCVDDSYWKDHAE